MKHFNEDFIGWFTWPRFYKDMVEKLPNGSEIVEVGVYEGKSLAYLMVEMINANKKFSIAAVDSFTFGGLFEKFTLNMIPVRGLFDICIGQSWDSAAWFDHESRDLVFLDADHVYESISKDIRAWWPMIKKGGVLGGHDYCEAHPGVAQAVDEFFGKENVCFDYIDELVWYVKKS